MCTWSGLERPRRSLGGPSTSLEASLGSLEVLGGSSGGHKGSLDVPRGVLEGPWRSLGGSSGVPRGSLGGPGRPPKQTVFFRSVSGRSWGALGVVLVLWGGPWVGPGKSKCCHFIDISDVSGMLGFSLIYC